MIHDLKPYPAMKDSGVPWLGQVPEHWDVTKIKRLFAEKEERVGKQDIPLMSLTRAKGLILHSDSAKRIASVEDLSKYKVCRPSDLVMNRMQAWSGMFASSDLTGAVSPDYSVFLRRQQGETVFFENLFKVPAIVDQFAQASRGIGTGFNRLYTPAFGAIDVVAPPPSEQAAIVRFLAHADRRIRKAIAAKQKLIKLLQEQKQVIIHQAVTRGLDPNVKLKPSGVEWLGDVPEGWEVLLFGRAIKNIEQGWSPVAVDGDLAQEQWAVLTLASIKRGEFHGTALKPIALTADIPTKLELREGDILLTRSNTRELVGDVCIVKSPRSMTLFSDLIYRISINERVLNSKYLVYQLMSPSVRLQIGRDARGSSGTMPKLAHGHIKSWRLVVPPLEAQERIADALEVQLADISEASLRAQQEISLLHEYRTRLIADVVTGKLDVRDAAARLPELTDEAVPVELDAEGEEVDGDELDAAEVEA